VPIKGEAMNAIAAEENLALARPRRPLFSRLYVQVIFAAGFGALLGYLEPGIGIALKPWSDTFIRAIRIVVAPIIFVTIAVGIAKMGDMKRVALFGVKALIYFEIVSTLALIIGMLVGNIWKIGHGINADAKTFDLKLVETYTQGAKSLTIPDFLLNIVPNNFIDPFAKGEILPVLFLALLSGFALTIAGEKSRPLVQLFDAIAALLFGMVRLIMYFAPLAALCAMAFTVGKYGFGALLELGQLVASVYLVSILFVLVVLGGLLKLAGFGIWQVLGYFKDEILFVFAATSAETMLPRSMEKLEKIGVSREAAGLIMPGGFAFNMDGTAIYMTMSVLFLAHAFNVELSLADQLIILFVMLFTSKGAAGVTGGGFIALAATLPVIQAVPVAGLALLLGVDRFMAEIRAATNLTSNIIATLVIGRWAGAVDMAIARRELGFRVNRPSA
jgi:Na+/H+-dicarboxylate symporter